MSSSRLPQAFLRGTIVALHQGECLVAGEGETIFSTVLGSCVSACVHDRVARVGGMNHFLLAAPGGEGPERFGPSARYGAFAMEELINKVLEAGSGRRDNLDFKVFGGGCVHRGMTDIGAQNARFILDFLEAENYRATSRDLGGPFARRVMFRPASGRAAVKRLESADPTRLVRAELAIAARAVEAGPPAVELF